jgi:hypothetical protein
MTGSDPSPTGQTEPLNSPGPGPGGRVALRQNAMRRETLVHPSAKCPRYWLAPLLIARPAV